MSSRARQPSVAFTGRGAPFAHSLNRVPLRNDTAIRGCSWNRRRICPVLTGSPVWSGTATVRVGRGGRLSPPRGRRGLCWGVRPPHDARGFVSQALASARLPPFGSSAGRRSGGRASGRGGTLLEKLSQTRRFRHRQLGRDLRLLTRAPLCDPSTPVWALCVTWASPRHGDFLTAWGLLVGQTSYTGLRASGVSVPANGAEAAPPTFMSQPWTRTPSLLPSQGSSRVTGQPRFHRCRGRSRPEQQTQKRPLPSSALPHASPVVMLMGTRGLDVLR